MNKNEILKTSRLENKDEREDRIRDESVKWVFLAMIVISAIFAFIRGIRGESVLDLGVIVCSSLTVFQFYRYFKLRKREYLIYAIIAFCTAVICLIGFCLGR